MQTIRDLISPLPAYSDWSKNKFFRKRKRLYEAKLQPTLYALFIDHVTALTGMVISDSEQLIIKQAFKLRSLRRKQYLLQEGDICRYIYFVIKGALRLYSVNSRNQECILLFATENCWIADRESNALEIPSRYNIDALENSELLQISIRQLEALSQLIPAIAEMLRIQYKQQAIATQQRIYATLSMNAEERYYDLLSCHPEYTQRFSQNMVAAYLGIKPETLSRVRNR